MTLPTFHLTLHPIVQTTFRVIVSATFFLATEWLLDCSGLDQIANYHEFLEHQQETVIHESTEKQVEKPIGKLFNAHSLQMKLT